jgi:hypothetical protein
MSFSPSGAGQVTAGTVPPEALAWILDTVLHCRHNITGECVEMYDICRLSRKSTISRIGCYLRDCELYALT